MVKTVTLVADDNQFYPVLMIEGRLVRTLIDSKSGTTMTFTPLQVGSLENDEGSAADCPPPGGMP